jgi:MFS family permease
VQVWVTLIAGAFTSGAGFWAFTLFVTPMGNDLGWSRPELYGAMTVRALGNAALAPFMGPLQDSKLGPRVFAVGTAVTMAASMILLKWVDDLLLFYLVFGLLGSLANFGSSEMMLSVVLPRWFVRQRGRALGIGSMGTALGPLLFPFIVTGLLSVFEWRDAWVALGVITLVVLLPVSLLVRARPEDMGLTPDGDASPIAASAPMRNAPSEHDFTRSEAVRLRAFWLIVFAASLTTLGTNGFHANWLPFFQDEGFSAAEGSLAATVYGICSLTTRVFWGWGAERISLRHLMAVQSVLTALSVLAFLLIDSRLVLILAAAFNGLSLGGIFIMRPMIVATYFGRGHLGALNGIMRPFVTAASALSPLMVAWIYDARGSYDLVFWLLAGCWLVAAAAVVLAHQPRRDGVAYASVSSTTS